MTPGGGLQSVLIFAPERSAQQRLDHMQHRTCELVEAPGHGVVMYKRGLRHASIMRTLSCGVRLQASDNHTPTLARAIPVHNQSTTIGHASTPEGQLNTEHAICYAWLSGLEEKASLAAVKLSDVNKGFGKRWKQTLRILDMNQ